MKVTIERTTSHYKLLANGAWVGGDVSHERFEADESMLTKTFSVASGITVTWEDGVKEHAFPFNSGAFAGYPPTCIPANGRLSKLLR